VDTQRILPDHPHWPLVFMLVLTQLSVGAMAMLWLLDLLGYNSRLWISAMVSLGLAGVSLSASTLHLGRPVYAWRALRGLRRSWLSREVLGLTLFAAVASLFAWMLWTAAPGRAVVGLVVTLFGVLGITCSARIYVVPARPAWNSGYTIADFFATALLLGPLLIRTMIEPGAPWIAWAAAAGGAFQLITQSLKFLWLSRSETFELRASSLLLSGRFTPAFLLRMGVLVAAGIVAPLASATSAAVIGAFAMALAGEWLGRWLFFVSVVPKNTAAAFSARSRTA
jgi:DMSO reductase anchor subunit